MAYGCAGSSPAFRTILKGSNNAKRLLPFFFGSKNRSGPVFSADYWSTRNRLATDCCCKFAVATSDPGRTLDSNSPSLIKLRLTIEDADVLLKSREDGHARCVNRYGG